MKTKSIYTLIGILFLCFSCGKRTLTKQEYQKWIQNHKDDVVKVKTINRLKYSVSFQPMGTLLLKADVNKNIKSDSKIALDYKNVMAFNLDITDTGETTSMLRFELANENEYYDRINYYTNLIGKDLYLVDGTDTLSCQFTHMEQTYNIAPVNTISLEFVRNGNPTEYNETWLVYNDRIFNSGILKFHFSKEDLNNIPEVKI